VPNLKEKKSKISEAKDPRSKSKLEESKEIDTAAISKTATSNSKSKSKSAPKAKSTSKAEEEADVNEKEEQNEKDDEEKSTSKPKPKSNSKLALGDVLPSLTLENDEGKEVDVSKLTEGGNGVVIFIYPKVSFEIATRQSPIEEE
jgi:peroxiredoxin Q/BCP